MLEVLKQWLAGSMRKPVAHKPVALHEHQWEKLGRLRSPVRDVFDCACGMRQIVMVGGLGVPESTRVITQGSSLDNVLINASLL